MAFDWAGYGVSMIALREMEVQRRYNAIMNSMLDIMKIPMFPAGYASDAREWYAWLLENPVNTPRWRR